MPLTYSRPSTRRGFDAAEAYLTEIQEYMNLKGDLPAHMYLEIEHMHDYVQFLKQGNKS